MSPPPVPIKGSRTRPPNTYTPWELPEWREFPRLFQKILPRISVRKMAVNWQEMVQASTSRKTTTPDEVSAHISELPTLNEDIIVESADGVKVMVFLKGGLARPWKPDVAKQILEGTRQAITALGEQYSPHMPVRSHEEDAVTLLTAEKPYGLYRFALWEPLGHANTVPSLPGETIDTTDSFGHVEQFFRGIGPLIQTISILFQGVDPSSYEKYLIDYNNLLDEETASRTLQTSNRACFPGMVLIRNAVNFEPHKDTGDVRDGWVAMCAWGSFEGGEMVLPELGMQLRLQEGDVVFLRPGVVEHFVAPVTGERAVTVFFTKGNGDEWVVGG